MDDRCWALCTYVCETNGTDYLACFWCSSADSESECRRGAAKKIDGPPRTSAKSQTHPPTIRLFLWLFFSTFLGVSRQGEFKNTTKIFLQKVHVENKIKNFDKNFDVSFPFFPLLFLIYRVFWCFSAMGVQKHYKKRFTKKIVSKSFYKKFDQKPKTDFFSIFFPSRFWAFLDARWGEQKNTNTKKYQTNKSDPSP
jgi:hypothetical protein